MTLLYTNILQSIQYYGTLRRYNWSMPKCRNFMRNLCDATYIEYYGNLRRYNWSMP